jgi:hypothetical protein
MRERESGGLPTPDIEDISRDGDQVPPGLRFESREKLPSARRCARRSGPSAVPKSVTGPGRLEPFEGSLRSKRSDEAPVRGTGNPALTRGTRHAHRE